MGMHEFLEARAASEPFPRERVAEALRDVLAARRQAQAALDEGKLHQLDEVIEGGASAMEESVQGLAALVRQLEQAADALKAACHTIEQVGASEARLRPHAQRMHEEHLARVKRASTGGAP